MTFEEFFKKKKINLVLLQQGDAGLYLEFRSQYGLMGEKSFDHTKKYWFNKLRHDYPLPPEIKTEKPKIENPIAEQTITESLFETVAPVQSNTKVGFIPRFKSSAILKAPVVQEPREPDTPQSSPAVENIAEPVPPKPGYQPRFKMKPKAEEPEQHAGEEKKTEQDDSAPAKPAYKPRFNMKNIPPKEGNDQAV